MFKFVVSAPHAGFRHLRHRDTDDVRRKQRRSEPSSDDLNKAQNKTTHASKVGRSIEVRNRGKDLSRTSTPAMLQNFDTATKTNTAFAVPKNAVTLEENECARNNSQHSFAWTCTSCEGEHIPRERVSSVRSRKESRANVRRCCASPARLKVKHSLSVRNKLKLTGDEQASGRYRRGSRMTRDYDPMPDCESDGVWLDLPSPTLLTSSPPQTALKVPATRATNLPFTIGLDENCNYLLTAVVNIKPKKGAGQKVNDVFFSSLKNVEKSALEETNFVLKSLQPQEPYLFSGHGNNTYYGTNAANPPNGFVSTKENRSQEASINSDPLLLDRTPFLVVEMGREDCVESASAEGMTKDASGTERTMAASLYPIARHREALCQPNDGKNMHTHIGTREVENIEIMNGNASHCDLRSKASLTFKGVISVDKAETTKSDLCALSHGFVSPGTALPASTFLQTQSNLELKAQEYFAMSRHSFVDRRTGSEARFRKPMSGKHQNSSNNRYLSDSDEDDDDATTITMFTNSDDTEELSSSSSSCESRDSLEISTSTCNRYDVCHTRTNPELGNEFMVERVQLFTRYNSKVGGCSGKYSPEERKTVVPRSNNTQSGKLPERLHAIIDDEQSLCDVTPTGSFRDLSTEGPRQHLRSEIDMRSPSQPSTAKVPPSPLLPRARISQLKGDFNSANAKASHSSTSLSVRGQSTSHSQRWNSLDRGLRGSFRSALSDVDGIGSVNSLRRGGNLQSDCGVSSYCTMDRSSRAAPLTSLLTDRNKPRIDVVESLSALISNPIRSSESDREILSEYLKTSSKNSFKGDALSSEDLRLGSTKYRFSPTLRRRKKESTSTSPDKSVDMKENELSTTTLENEPRESKIISKSQTPNRYPTVEISPRSTASLPPPSPRESNLESEVIITIVDNEVPGAEHEQFPRRNSFIEAVTGSSENSHSNDGSELSNDSIDLEQAFHELEIAAQEASLTTRDHAVKLAKSRTDKGHICDPNSPEKRRVSPEEVGVNLSKDPVSKDLAVAFVRRPSVSRQRSSSTSPLFKPVHPNNHNQGNVQRIVPTVVHPSPMDKATPSYVDSCQSNDKVVNGILAEAATVKCRNPCCRKEKRLEDAKIKFKSCHHCYTYYCSQQCRLEHWERHKTKCVLARANSDCKKILRMGRENDVVRQAFTRVARTGYLSRGRGCVQVIFSGPEEAERFISEGLFALESLPLYRTTQELRELKKHLTEDGDLITDCLIETCETAFDADKSYVLQVLVDIPEQMLATYDRPYRHPNLRGAYIHAVNPVYKSEQDLASPQTTSSAPETLILTPPTTIPEAWLAPPAGCFRHCDVTSASLSSVTTPCTDATRNAKRARQLCFISIQRKLREKGVTLRHQYPDIYRKLCSYVDTGAHFTPVVIYPRDTRTGKNFMCLVMPGSEPQILGWVQTPGLLEDITTG